MRFAIVNGQLEEAMPGLKGICPGCDAPMVAKCGDMRIEHWAHKNRTVCDDWWEPETLWHRTWKNHFPKKWQENFLTDEVSGEKHIADILTDYGFVIEFQHSHITPEERRSREHFYKHMVWLVDGTRLKRDCIRFLKNQSNFSATDKKYIYHVQQPKECFPESWLDSSVPVIFDFEGAECLTKIEKLYCVFPQRVAERVTVAVMSRTAFIGNVNNGDWLSRLSAIMKDLDQEKADWEEQVAKLREIDKQHQ